MRPLGTMDVYAYTGHFSKKDFVTECIFIAFAKSCALKQGREASRIHKTRVNIVRLDIMYVLEVAR